MNFALWPTATEKVDIRKKDFCEDPTLILNYLNHEANAQPPQHTAYTTLECKNIVYITIVSWCVGGSKDFAMV